MYLITSRYISKNVLSICILVTLVLTSIIWLTQSLRLLELIVSSSAPIWLLFKMIILSLPKFLEVIFPVAIMTAIIFVYNKMITDNELVIMRSAGMSPFTLAKPAIILSSIVTFLLFTMSAWLTPISLTEVQNLKNIVKAEYSTFLLREGVFNPIGSNLTVYLRNRGERGELKGLLIHDTRPENKSPVTITAKRGLMFTEENEPKVIVYDGIRQTIDTNTNSLSILEFEEYTLEIKDFQAQVRKRWRAAKERTLTELLSIDKSNKQDIEHLESFKKEALKRIITPFSAIGYAFVTLACMLTGTYSRRGQNKKILTAIIAVLILQSIYLGLANLIKTNFLAVPALYIAIILPILIGFIALSDKGYNAIIKNIVNPIKNIRKKR